MFFPQTDPDERLSQCSASLQALLALSSTTLGALSKLVNNVDVSDDIIGVMRNVVAQYPPKGSAEGETNVEITLSVRLWRVSGCHELLASLGFDLMEVGQDQVTLRTGKQANRRNCQFVLQALLALFDTQEAPKSLGIDSSSSCESLNEDIKSERRANSPILGASAKFQRTASPKSFHLKMPRPPLSSNRFPLLGRGSAFISYVKKRGEPDGGRTDGESKNPPIASLNSHDLSLTNTTDSEFSDGYSSQLTLKLESKSKLGYSNLRAPIKVGRPGGGGESDAAFTPSPPVVIQPIDNNVSIALAHQTRIRNLYSANSSSNEGHLNEMPQPPSQRPGSSSSLSSANDWDGHATILRRTHNQSRHLPPIPPPRQTIPFDENVRPLAPLAPVYNNLSRTTNTSAIISAIESTSSDSEFERFDARDRMIHKPSFLPRRIAEEISFLDRLSVRSAIPTTLEPVIRRQPKPIETEDDVESKLPFKMNANNSHFPPNEIENSPTAEHPPSEKLTKQSTKTARMNGKNIPESILRHREMTPTISEVYHERNLGLGLAPSLSKLLLSKNYEEPEPKAAVGNVTETIAEINSPTPFSEATNETRCSSCNIAYDCTCKMSAKKSMSSSSSSTKSWLSMKLTNKANAKNDADPNEIIEMQPKSSTANGKEAKADNSIEPANSYSDLSKRDEGDGRSVADSQCSGNYKTVDLKAATKSKVSQIQDRIMKFNLNANSST